MKTVIIFIGFIFVLGMHGFAQTAKTTGDSTAASTSSVNSDNGKGTLASGTRIDGQLQSSVDVKRSRVGDPVILKTTHSLKQNGQIVIPKGSTLIGRITEVQRKSRSNASSRLGMIFERIQGKNLNAPISASIVSITNAAASSSTGDDSGSDVFGSTNTSAAASRGRSSGGSSGSSSSGGLVGGVSNTVGGVLNTTTRAAGNISDNIGQSVGSTFGSLGQAINGIQISNALNGSLQTGTTLSSTDRNIRLEKGVMVQLQLNSATRSQ